MSGLLAKKRILVTYGPTWVAIDNMRVISNRSSGLMGKSIVNGLLKEEAEVTALEGPIVDPLKINNRRLAIKKFMFFDDFTKIFKKELKKNYDMVIHAAAVSDFQPAKKFNGKIASEKNLCIKFAPTEKLIRKIKRISPKSFLVGFKLESTSCEKKLRKEALISIKTNQCDLIVANTLTPAYCGFIFNNQGDLLTQGRSRDTISKHLIKHLVTLCS